MSDYQPPVTIIVLPDKRNVTILLAATKILSPQACVVPREFLRELIRLLKEVDL